MRYKPGTFREVSWDEVRLEIKKITPDLFHAIEKISPNASYKLYLAEYSYGVPLIGDEGIFQIQIGENLIPINSSEMPKSIKDQLSYNHHGNPLGIVLRGQLQLSSSEVNDRAYPEVIFERGSVFATQAAIDLPNKYQATYYWRIHSGARTVYMLPSISNREKFAKLKRHLNLTCDLPTHQKDHWNLFCEIANCNDFPVNWRCQCLFFGKKFIEKLRAHPEFYLAITKRVHEGSINVRSSTLDRMWQDNITRIRNKLVDRYILTMGWHIIRASLGDHVSFRLGTNEDSSGPFSEIVKVMVDTYGLKKYAPIIMTPQMYNHKTDPYTYISIQLPAIDCERKRGDKSKYLMADYREIKYVIEQFLDNIRPEVIGEVPLYNFRNYNYNFYTADQDSHGHFLKADAVFNEDPNLKYWLSFKNKKVDTRNSFLRACVRIS